MKIKQLSVYSVLLFLILQSGGTVVAGPFDDSTPAPQKAEPIQSSLNPSATPSESAKANVNPDTPASDSALPALVASIPDQLIDSGQKLTDTAPSSKPGPQPLISLDQIDAPDSMQIVGPFPLDACDVEQSGTTVTVGRTQGGGLTKKVIPLAALTIQESKIMWEWKDVLDTSAADKKFAQWLRYSKLRILKGDEALATLQFCPVEEQTISLDAIHAQKLTTDVSPTLLALTALMPVPTGWGASRTSRGTALTNTANPNVRFTVEFDSNTRTIATSWRTGVQYAKSKKEDAELAITKLKTELAKVQQQIADLQRATGNYSSDTTSQNYPRIRDEFAALEARKLSIPRDISTKQKQADAWDERAAAFSTIGPFEASLRIRTNSVVTYHFRFVPETSPDKQKRGDEQKQDGSKDGSN